MEREIMRLAREHYNWKEPEPSYDEIKYPETKEWLKCMTAEERLSSISGILLDWDGYRTVRGLGGLIDEVLSYSCFKNYRSIKELEYWINFWKTHDIKQYLNENKKSIYTVPSSKMEEVKEWCKEHNKDYENICLHRVWDLIDFKIIEG